MSGDATAHPPGSLVERSACDVLKAFADGTVTPSDYLSACLDQISRVNGAINALTAFDTERAIVEATQSTKRWRQGCPKGPLDGLPIGVKDLQDTEGLLTSYGSPRMRSYVPAADAPMVARLRAAGAIVLAKTNVPELGAGGNSRNPVWGVTGNPFDPRLIAGGSSGGSAAALAADLVPLCTGSDTGGSQRLPAALCGIVGYRPSVDVVAHPTRPLGWSGISVIGPLARNMNDLVLMLRTVQGYDPRDPLSAPRPAARFDTLQELRLEDLRVGVSEDFGGAPVDPAIRGTFLKRVETLAPHVKSCRPVDLDLGDMDRTFDILRAESFVAAYGKAVREAPEDFAEHVRGNVEMGFDMTLEDRAWAHLEQTRILRNFHERMEDFDIVLLPTVPVSPFPWEDLYPRVIDGQSMDTYYRWLALTYRGSLSGGPSVTVPAGLDPHGMPFGLQILGRLHGDENLLAAARAVEAHFALNRETARPRPDLAKLAASRLDLRAMVTHPPVGAHAGQGLAAIRTAV